MADEKVARGARLDGLGREVVRASAADEREAEAAAGSPFLYARVRASIEAERRRGEGEGWLALFAVAWRAVPALGLVAAFALALFISAARGGETAAATTDEVLIGEREADIEQVVFASTGAPSSDEVLSNIVGLDEKEGAR